MGTGTEDIVNLCKDKGLKSPEYHQEEDFRVVIWRRGSQTIQGDPEQSRDDPDGFGVCGCRIRIDQREPFYI